MSVSNGLAVIEHQPAAVATVDDEWNQQRIDFIRKQYGGAPDAQIDVFLHICRSRRLSPEEKHIYLVSRAGDWVIQTGIDGYRLMADRSGLYAGSDDPTYELDDNEMPTKATVTVWKMIGGQRCPFTASARWVEYYPGDKQGFMWKRMPFLMIGKCAEALALRKAFPAELSGIYTDAEMDQAGREPAGQPRAAASEQAKPAATKSIARGKSAAVDWTAMWTQLRARKIDGETYESIVGKSATSFGTPEKALEALAKAAAASESQAAESGDDDPVDAEYAEVTDADQAPMFAPGDPNRYTQL